MAYIGVSPSNGVRRVHTYTVSGSSTDTFSGAGAEGTTLSYKDSNFVDVYQNGVKLADADYTATNGTSIVLGTTANDGDIVVIVTFDVFSVADTVSKADGGQFDGNITMAGTLGVTGAVTANAGVNVDNITIDGQEIDVSSGDLTLDVDGDIILDADGDQIRFKANGTQFGLIGNESSDFLIQSSVQDKDIVFQGNDGGSAVEPIRIDMSNDGAVTIQNKNGGSGLILNRDFSGSDVGGSFTNSAQLDFSMTDSATTQTVARISPQAKSGTGDAFRGNLRFFTSNSAGTLIERGSFNNNGTLDVTAGAGSDYALKIHNDRDNTDGYGLRIKCGTDDASGSNIAIGFQDGNGSGVGNITFTGGTVSYNPFTGSHPCIVPDADNDENSDANAYPYGTLLEVTSISYTQKDGADTERGILYNVQKSSSAKSKAVIGAYSGSMNGTPIDDNTNATNKHLVHILGDGHILCNNENGNIAVGDYICTSSTSGEGMKATSICATIGIARQAITFTDSTAVLVAVEYGYRQFIPEDIEARITALENA